MTHVDWKPYSEKFPCEELPENTFFAVRYRAFSKGKKYFCFGATRENDHRLLFSNGILNEPYLSLDFYKLYDIEYCLLSEWVKTIDWKPYPQTKPKKSEKTFVSYLVLLREGAYETNVITGKWNNLTQRWMETELTKDIVAWAEMPPPYEPED